MVLALGLTLAASVLCALEAPRGWRHRVHHLLPVLAMAFGMGHLGAPAGLPVALLGAGALWVCAVHLGRRTRRGESGLGADAVDFAAMAVALVVAAPSGSARHHPAGHPLVVGVASHHATHEAPLSLSGASSAGLLVAAGLLGACVLATRVLLARHLHRSCASRARFDGCRQRIAVSVAAAALMAVATTQMLVT